MTKMTPEKLQKDAEDLDALLGSPQGAWATEVTATLRRVALQPMLDAVSAWEADRAWIEALERVRTAAQAEMNFRLPAHDYGWTCSREYAAIRTSLQDALAKAQEV